MPDYKIGSSDQNTGGGITHWQQWFQRYARSYAPPIDGYYGTHDEGAVRILQSKLGIVVDGIFGDRTAFAAGYKFKGAATVPLVQPRRPIWLFSAPGSGADWWMGPSFELGELVCGHREPQFNLRINHQPLAFQKGGYLGLMGGDSKFSYNDVIADLASSLDFNLGNNPDVQKAMELRRSNPTAKVDVELWFSGYSQSADGIEEAVVKLFGPGGKYDLIRDRINGIIQYGNPSTRDTGIARKVRPDWLYRLVTNINKPNDFYAVVPANDKIRPAFYNVIVEAEMELPFFTHVLMIAVPVVMKWASSVIPAIGPLLAGVSGPFGPMVQLAMGMISGLGAVANNPLLGGFMGQAATGKDQDVHDDLVNLLTPMGLLTNIPGLIGIIAALPGLQAHGMYDAVDIGRAYDVIACFRR
jgi:Putative peptidoglycan binding domain